MRMAEISAESFLACSVPAPGKAQVSLKYVLMKHSGLRRKHSSYKQFRQEQESIAIGTRAKRRFGGIVAHRLHRHGSLAAQKRLAQNDDSGARLVPHGDLPLVGSHLVPQDL